MARLIIRSILLFVLWLVDAPLGPAPQIWSVIAIDPKGDGRDASLADAAQLSYRYDKALDMLWFRVSLFNRPTSNNLSVKIAVDASTNDNQNRSFRTI